MRVREPRAFAVVSSPSPEKYLVLRAVQTGGGDIGRTFRGLQAWLSRAGLVDRKASPESTGRRYATVSPSRRRHPGEAQMRMGCRPVLRVPVASSGPWMSTLARPPPAAAWLSLEPHIEAQLITPSELVVQRVGSL